ncbi:hypothetical protein ACO9S2_12365 [Nitrospira sp. NS4]|uniref:hypothetical protein n=1 Tax=Nitrospira sp. NS4 TaxID=3414498 RepID=UPI003C306F5A
MAPKFATSPSSDPAEKQNYSKGGHGGGPLYTFKWQNSHGLHAAVNATKWVIWIGQNAGGGEKYKTQNPIQDTGSNIITDTNIPDAALPIGATLWVTPKYQKADGSWNDGTSTQFTVVA